MKVPDFILEIFLQKAMVFVLGGVCFVLILLTTLNLSVAITVFLLFVFLAVFQKSFSRGWLFTFFVFLLLPRFNLGGTELAIVDILLIVLTLISLSIVAEKRVKKDIFSKISSFFLILGALSLIGWIIEKVGNYSDNNGMLFYSFTLVVLAVLVGVLQYFFQTAKRIRKFFSVLVIAGSLHSLFSLLAFIFPAQVAFLEQGVYSGKTTSLIFEEIELRASGFWGNSYQSYLGNDALAGFLIISLSITVGLIIIAQQKVYQKKPEGKKDFQEKTLFSQKSSLDSIQATSASTKIKNKIVNLKQGRHWFAPGTMILNDPLFLMLLFLIQVAGLLITFSYLPLLVFSLGIFFMGVLFRSRGLLSLAASLIIILSVALPGFRASLVEHSTDNFQQWFSGFEQIKGHWILGQTEKFIFNQKDKGIKPEPINNSYFFVWNRLGLVGLLIFLMTLAYYFLTVRKIYLRSDGWQRVWLIIILAIFFEMIILGIASNILLFGPSAICFWLFSGLAENLRERKIVFGEKRNWGKRSS